MKALEVTFGHAIRVWWAYTWRLFLISIILVTIFDVIIWLIRPHDIGFIIFIILYIILIALSLWFSMWIFKVVLAKKYRHFKIVLVARDTEAKDD